MVICCNTEMHQGKTVTVGFHSAHVDEKKEDRHTWFTRVGHEYTCTVCGKTVVHMKSHARYCAGKPIVDMVVEE